MRRLIVAAVLLSASCATSPQYDVVIRHGTVYDGTGAAGAVADVAIQGDRIAAVGALGGARGRQEVDAAGLAVAPGFIDMLNHSETALIADGRSQSGIRQGVTLAVFGESSMGPFSEAMKHDMQARQGDIKFEITWNTLGEYLDSLAARGVSTNVASFVSASTIRAKEIGLDNRAPTAEELDRMREDVRRAMGEGAMGVTTALIYTPAVFATTDGARRAGEGRRRESGGMYISHMRSEGNRLLEAIDETLTIAREAHIRAEIYHLKAAGQQNWSKLDAAIAKIEAARKEGLDITADMYTYTAGSTGLDASMPPWVQEGGYNAWAARLRDAKIRARVRKEMVDAGRRVGEPAARRPAARARCSSASRTRRFASTPAKRSPKWRSCAASRPRIRRWISSSKTAAASQVVYFLMSEDNVKRQIRLPWVSFGSDASSHGAGGRVPEDQHASARLRQLRPAARQVRARRARRAAGGSDPQADVAAGRHAADQGSRTAGRGRIRRRRGVRPERRSPIAPPTRSRTSTRSACATCGSTARRC